MASPEVRQLRQELAETQAKLNALESRVGNGAGGRGSPSPYGRPPARTFHSVEQWVNTWFIPTVERRTSNTRRWCPWWYKHPEAVARMQVLFASYTEITRNQDAVALSSWWVEHFDKHIEVLMSADGPFAGCSAQRHSPSRPLEVHWAPAGTWGPEPSPATRPAP